MHHCVYVHLIILFIQRPDNIGTRIDCSIEEFPERQSTVLVGTEVILFLDSLQILLPGSNFSSGIYNLISKKYLFN